MSTTTLNEILRLVLITTFGKNSIRPFKSAVRKLGLSSSICLMLSSLLSRLISHTQLPNDLPPIMVTAFFSSVAFLISGLACLIFYVSMEQSQLTVYRILATLPVSKFLRIIIKLAPILFICGLLIFLLTPLAFSAAHMMNLKIYLAITSVIFGILAGAGICLWHLPKPNVLKPVFFTLISAACLLILEKSIYLVTPNLSLIEFLILAIAAAGFGQISQGNNFARKPAAIKKVNLIFSRSIVYNGWFLIKILRNRRSANALLICLVIIIATSVIIIKKHVQNMNGPVGLLIFSVTITIAFACDIRGISRYYRPPEIFGLRGINFFVKAEVVTTILLSLLIGLPILAALLISNMTNSGQIIMIYLGLQMFGGLAGLIGSTLYVPQAGEIGPQFFAAATAIGLFFVIEKLFKVLEYTPQIQILLWSLLGGICIVLVLIVEKLRKSKYGYIKPVS